MDNSHGERLMHQFSWLVAAKSAATKERTKLSRCQVAALTALQAAWK